MNWHQDCHYFGTASPKIISCGLYLEDTDQVPQKRVEVEVSGKVYSCDGHTREVDLSWSCSFCRKKREREREPCDKTDLSILVLMSTVLRT